MLANVDKLREREVGIVTRYAGRVWIFVNELHVLHQHFSAHTELVTDGAAARVGTTHQGLVLLQVVNISTESSEEGQ